MLDLKANPNRRASGAVIESTLDKGRGYVATVLVQNGTLHIGDVMLSGVHTGRVKAMFNENGQKVTEAGPSTPVQVLGLNGAPQAGDTFNVMEDDRSAREIANKREQAPAYPGHHDAEARDARRNRTPHRHRIIQGAEYHCQRRCRWFGRGYVGFADQALEGDRAGECDPLGRRSDFGIGRSVGGGLERHHRRLPGPSVGVGTQGSPRRKRSKSASIRSSTMRSTTSRMPSKACSNR